MLLAPVLPDPEADATDTPLTSVRTRCCRGAVTAPDVPDPSPRARQDPERAIDTPGRQPAMDPRSVPDGRAVDDLLASAPLCA